MLMQIILFSLFDKAVSWDLNPGAQYTFDQGTENATGDWAFRYSTRVAVYKIIPKTAIVGEVYGSSGGGSAHTEYRVGLRYEPNNYFIPALTYGNTTDGSRGPGVEIGVLIISPPFLFD